MTLCMFCYARFPILLKADLGGGGKVCGGCCIVGVRE